MRRRVIVCLAAVALSHACFAERRNFPCKIPSIADTCYQIHGRLLQANGTPSMRLWRIGTNRILGVYSSLARYQSEQAGHSEDSEAPELPANVHLGDFHDFIEVYGDFAVCPLKPSIPGHMQPVCIESATNLVYKKQ